MDWNSSRLRPPAISSLAAESAALNTGLGKVELVRDVVSDFFSIPDPKVIKAELHTDCRSLYDAIKSDGVIKDRRSAVAIATLRQIDKKDNIEFCWLPGRDNIADHLTKQGTNTQNLLDVLSGKQKLPA